VTSTTPQQEALVDTPLAEITERVHEAQDAIAATLRSDPDRQWRPRELMDAARGNLSSTDVSIAFWKLVELGELKVDKQLTVRSVELV
jgi:hypothetical protein